MPLIRPPVWRTLTFTTISHSPSSQHAVHPVRSGVLPDWNSHPSKAGWRSCGTPDPESTRGPTPVRIGRRMWRGPRLSASPRKPDATEPASGQAEDSQDEHHDDDGPDDPDQVVHEVVLVLGALPGRLAPLPASGSIRDRAPSRQAWNICPSARRRRTNAQALHHAPRPRRVLISISASMEVPVLSSRGSRMTATTVRRSR